MKRHLATLVASLAFCIGLSVAASSPAYAYDSNDPVDTGCSKTGVVEANAYSGSGVVRLMHSTPCHKYWALVENVSAGTHFWVRDYYGHYYRDFQTPGTWGWTDMIPDDWPGLACMAYGGQHCAG